MSLKCSLVKEAAASRNEHVSLSKRQTDDIVDRVAKKLEEKLNLSGFGSIVKSPSPHGKSRSSVSSLSSGVRFRGTMEMDTRTVELCATARILKNDSYAGNVYLNTNDKKAVIALKHLTKNGTKRSNAKGRRIGNASTAKSLGKVELKIGERLDSLKGLLDGLGYKINDEVEADTTEMAQLREDDSKVVFERLYVYKRIMQLNENDEDLNLSGSSGGEEGFSDEEASDHDENSNEFDEIEISNATMSPKKK